MNYVVKFFLLDLAKKNPLPECSKLTILHVR